MIAAAQNAIYPGARNNHTFCFGQKNSILINQRYKKHDMLRNVYAIPSRLDQSMGESLILKVCCGEH